MAQPKKPKNQKTNLAMACHGCWFGVSLTLNQAPNAHMFCVCCHIWSAPTPTGGIITPLLRGESEIQKGKWLDHTVGEKDSTKTWVCLRPGGEPGFLPLCPKHTPILSASSTLIQPSPYPYSYPSTDTEVKVVEVCMCVAGRCWEVGDWYVIILSPCF